MGPVRGKVASEIKDYYKKIFDKKGYDFYEDGDYNLNIIGVRSWNDFTNEFDDAINLIYKEDGDWVFRTYVATTDPGENALADPLSDSGAAILVPGQYRSYRLDLHRGRYYALCQREGTVKVYRDNNRDKKYDYDPSTIEEGWFGINIHRASTRGDTHYVNSWSHGCQVFGNIDEYYEFISICEKAADIQGPVFTYTLIEQGDL